jgi:hypothetical protein
MPEQSRKAEFTFFRKGGKGMLFLFCFLVAAIIWVVNALSKTYVTELTYTVITTSGKEKATTPVKATLKGQGFALMRALWKLNNNKYPVSGFHSAINCIQLTDSLLGKFRNDISLMNVEPAMLAGRTESGKKTKKVPVKSRINASFAPQYGSVIPMLIKPEMAEVTGPAFLIDTLKAVYSEELTLPSLTLPLFRSVLLKSPSVDCWVQPAKVWIYIPVEEFTEATLKIPLSQRNNEENVKFIPEVVTVKCLVPLNRYNSISPSQFRVELSGPSAEGEEKTTVFVSRKPSFAKNIRIEPAAVSVLIFDK